MRRVTNPTMVNRYSGSGSLKLQQRSDNAGSKNDAIDQMVGQLGCHRFMRERLDIDVLRQELFADLPDGVVAAMNTTPLS